jgi:hypothetical protein
MAILNLWTSYFKEECEFNEESTMHTCTVKGISDTEMRAFLVKVYPPCDLVISEHNLRNLATISHAVHCGKLMESCLNTAVRLPMTAELAFTVDKFPDEFKKVKPVMIEWLSENFHEIQHDPKFKEFSKDTILEVVSKKNEVQDPEEERPAKKPRLWGWFGF